MSRGEAMKPTRDPYTYICGPLGLDLVGMVLVVEHLIRSLVPVNRIHSYHEYLMNGFDVFLNFHSINWLLK